MNMKRRKELDRAIARIQEAAEKASLAKEIVEECLTEEQQAFDNMPESFQNSESGEAAESVIACLENAAQEIDGFDLDAVLDSIMEAKE
jgi:hypothetical protein